MQRNPTAARSFFTPGRFGTVSRPDRAKTYQPRTQAAQRPATDEQTERPTLFASLCQSLIEARHEEPVGGDVSPLLWW
jgi:hypothetical protein